MDGVAVGSVFLWCWWARSELLRDRERVSAEGGGDFSRGDSGQWGVFSVELGPEDGLEGRGTREGSWVEVEGGSCGMLVEERARWMAAAERTVELELAVLESRLGLASLLLLREGRVGLGCESAG